ncbi:MAG TPA: proton-conducting transporter membrane subunit [Bacteroidia bacterium]
MTLLIQFFILLPLLGFIISLLIPNEKETLISRTAFFTIGLHLVSSLAFSAYWLLNNHPTLDTKDVVIFQVMDEYRFFIDFCFDKITAIYLLVGAFLTFLVTVYSRYYLHRESGYKRFFNTILFFYFGYNIAIFSDNLETLFVGWEILGISSFLLIAFYRDRYLPVRNAMKIFSIYRLGDAGIILAMWMMHHLCEKNVTFIELSNYQFVHEHLQDNRFAGIFISLMIIVAAAAKSAQLPFSSWLPRAMEGPTPSSAIFYGSLSVNLGAFLLLRMYPFWDHQLGIQILIAAIGLSTAIIATLTARVQSTIKSQIAYSSIAQIGLVFIEIAAGFNNLALFHFAGNAFLRTYQLLVSPSVVSYLIREQFYNFIPRKDSVIGSFPKKIEYSIYMLSLKEWNLDFLMYRVLWNPLKWIGRKLNFITTKRVLVFFIPAYIIGLICLYKEDSISEDIEQLYLPFAFSLIGLIMVLKSFAERKDVTLSWILIIMNHFWVALAISFNEQFEYTQIYLYLSGIVVFGILGYICLYKLQSLEGTIDMNQFLGYSYKYPRIAFFFLLSCLGLAGFPITPTFIGEDLIYTHIHEGQLVLVLYSALSFIVVGISLIRMYSRIFLGPYNKTYHEIAYRSS